jgi:hypothetical protein
MLPKVAKKSHFFECVFQEIFNFFIFEADNIQIIQKIWNINFFVL